MLIEREGEIIVEYTLPVRGRSPSVEAEPGREPPSRPSRCARLVALAHKLEEFVQSGAVKSYGELARLGHISPARLSQIMILAQVAPSIQEYVLFHSANNSGTITELELRKIARDPSWGHQREKFAKLKEPV
jgi:hypothetical protein